jgi:protein O-GlcNAc transferase
MAADSSLRPLSTAGVASIVADARRARDAGRRSEAAALLAQALTIDSDHVEALQDYAMLALEAGQSQIALAAATRWSLVCPGSPGAKNLLGVACRHCGRLADAIARLREAVALDPDFFDARVNLGNALLDSGDAEAALPHYRRAQLLDPLSASVHNNLGNLHRELRRPTEALACYRRALELEPGHARAWNNAGNILKDFGDTDGAIDAFHRSIALAPDRPDAWSNLLFTLNTSDRTTAERIAEEHRAFGLHFERLLPPLSPTVAPPLEGRRLRVGYVSSDFRKHAVATFFVPLLEAHDRSRFEVFCYYNQPRGDEVTARIQSLAEHFVPAAGVPDRQLAGKIRADGIDILVDLNGHTAENRLPLFFLRPAPVQATWLGYLGPTGVPTIDWRVTDSFADPEGSAIASGLERPWRLPRTMWCYAPYAEALDVAPIPSAAGDQVTFGCLNNPGKVSPTILAAWVEILLGVPGSRLLVPTSPDAGRVDALRCHFTERGVAPDRVEFLARVPLGQYLARYGRIDIALDTWPYGGGTTTCDALWMGVPVVTLASERPFARSGATILAQLGLEEFVASTPVAYVSIARDLAANRDRRVRLREGLRRRMAASDLTDARGFCRDFEAALVGMWKARVEPPEPGAAR